MNALAPIAKEDGPLVALDLEQQVLGGLLANNKVFDRVAAFLQPEHFGDARHSEIFASIKAMIESGRPATAAMLSGFLDATGTLANVGGNSYIAKIITGVASPQFTEDYARAILDLWSRRQAVAVIEGAAMRLRRADLADPASDQLALAATQLDELATLGTVPSVVPVGDAGDQIVEAVTDIVDHGVVPKLVPTGLTEIDRVIGGLEDAEYIILAARPSMGKAQPLDASVLMEDGSWKFMAHLRMGDRLASVDGGQSLVAGIFPQGEREVFRVTFSDGRTATACGEHLWRVGNRKWIEDKILDTRALMVLLEKPSYANRLYIPTPSGHYGHHVPLDMDPWLLGALIGNGSFRESTPQFSTADAETLWRVQELIEAAGGRLSRVANDGYDYRIAADGPNEIARQIRTLGLDRMRSEERFIPVQYLRANRQARLDLMRGLMDTDGWVEKEGALRYSTSSKRLADGVVGLVRSLGGLASITEKMPAYTYKGERRVGQQHYTVRIRHHNPREFIRLLRKKRRAPEHNEVRLNITKIESIGVQPVQCIAVTHPDHLYITDNWVVTHNTALAQAIAQRAAKAGHGVAFFSIEMAAAPLTRRWISAIANVPAMALKTGQVWENRYGQKTMRPLSRDEMDRIRAARDELKKLPIHLDAGASPTAAEIVASVRKMQRERRAVDLVIVDYLGLMRSQEHWRSRTEAVTAISQELKAAAKKLGKPLLVLSQLSRANESRDDKRPQLHDLRDSGAIEQDADSVWLLHREHYYLARGTPQQKADEEDGKFAAREQAHRENCRRHEGKAELNIAKSRNGAVETIRLAFHDAATRFDNLAPEDEE